MEYVTLDHLPWEFGTFSEVSEVCEQFRDPIPGPLESYELESWGLLQPKLWCSPHQVCKFSMISSVCQVTWLSQLITLLPVFMMEGGKVAMGSEEDGMH